MRYLPAGLAQFCDAWLCRYLEAHREGIFLKNTHSSLWQKAPFHPISQEGDILQHTDYVDWTNFAFERGFRRVQSHCMLKILQVLPSREGFSKVVEAFKRHKFLCMTCIAYLFKL